MYPVAFLVIATRERERESHCATCVTWGILREQRGQLGPQSRCFWMICECLLECFGFSMIYGCFWMITTSTGAIWAISKILAATQLGIFF